VKDATKKKKHRCPTELEKARAQDARIQELVVALEATRSLPGLLLQLEAAEVGPAKHGRLGSEAALHELKRATSITVRLRNAPLFALPQTRICQ
jgi:hypothetical protein